MDIVKETSPYLRRKDNLRGMMIDVLVALAPVVVFALAVFQWDAVRNLLLPSAIMILSELVFVLIRDKGTLKNFTINNVLVPLVSGLIFGLIMPAKTSPDWMIYVALITGSLFGIIIGKLVFGGTGQNIFNPAAVGMVFAKLCFGSTFTYASTWYSNVNMSFDGSNVIIGPTVLGGGNYSLFDLFLGKVPGTIGEVCKIAILVGMIYLLIRRAADWRIIVSYLGSFLFLFLFAGILYQAGGKLTTSLWEYILTQLFSGGVLFGAVYMATDPVTSPLSRPGRMLYGIILGISTVMIRLFGSLPEGVVFSILIGNMFTPVIDYYKWASSKYTWKNILVMGCSLTAALLIVIWALSVEVFK